MLERCAQGVAVWPFFFDGLQANPRSTKDCLDLASAAMILDQRHELPELSAFEVPKPHSWSTAGSDTLHVTFCLASIVLRRGRHLFVVDALLRYAL